MAKENYPAVSFFLRAGISIAFFYAAISAFVNPNAWMGYIPVFIQNLINPGIFLYIHSAFNLILGLWLLSNKKTFYASIVSAGAMLAIIAFNINAFDIVFRDIAILFSAIALAFLTSKKE